MFVNETLMWTKDLKEFKEIEKKQLNKSTKKRNLFFTALVATAAVAALGAIVIYRQDYFHSGNIF